MIYFWFHIRIFHRYVYHENETHDSAQYLLSEEKQ